MSRPVHVASVTEDPVVTPSGNAPTSCRETPNPAGEGRPAASPAGRAVFPLPADVIAPHDLTTDELAAYIRSRLPRQEAAMK